MSFLRIDLFGLVNTELIELNGEVGVFVPLRPNIDIVRKGKREFAMVSISTHKSSNKRVKTRGRQRFPNQYMDDMLKNSYPHPDHILWEFRDSDAKASTSTLTKEMFEDIIGDD